MGLIASHAAFLLNAKQNDVAFEEILTIGRQTLYVTPTQCEELAKRYGRHVDGAFITHGPFAEEFLKAMLDAKTVKSMDCSDYEQCDIVHDLNLPVDPSLHEQFDAIIDGGTLEHVFNFPVAISNCMKMLRKNGNLFIFTTANNFLGHGFYQFSPELFFRVFSAENGFEVRTIILERHAFPGVELSAKTKIYTVADAAMLGERVGLVSSSPVMLLVHAVRKEVREPFSRFPIQADYALRYGDQVPLKASGIRTLAAKLLASLPAALRSYLIGKYQLSRYSFSNRFFYRQRRPF